LYRAQAVIEIKRRRAAGAISLLTIIAVLAPTGCGAKETPAQPHIQSQTPVQAKIPVTVEQTKVETYGLTATGLQLLTNEVDES